MTGWHAMNTDVGVIPKDLYTLIVRIVDTYDYVKMYLTTQINRGKRCVIVDANLFLAYDLGNTHEYLRYSYDGIFPTTGEYCYDNLIPSLEKNATKTKHKSQRLES